MFLGTASAYSSLDLEVLVSRPLLVLSVLCLHLFAPVARADCYSDSGPCSFGMPQMEGSIIFGMSIAMHGAITMKGGVPDQMEKSPTKTLAVRTSAWTESPSTTPSCSNSERGTSTVTVFPVGSLSSTFT